MKSAQTTRYFHALLPALALLAAALPDTANAQSACPQHYASAPPQLINVKLQSHTRELCSAHFAVLHSGVTRTPIYTAELLTRDSVGDAKEQVRYNTFHPDTRLPPNERSELRDFARSGYDRGHMAPSGDMPNLAAQEESFALSNMIPQNPQNNRYLWAGIESTARQMAKRTARMYVVSGVIFSGAQIKTVGGRVMVPTHLFKALYNPKTGEASAYLVRNDAGGQYATADMATIERLSGIRPFPDVKLTMNQMSLPTPIARGSKSSSYQKVSADLIMGSGTDEVGLAQPHTRPAQHRLPTSHAVNPVTQIAQAIFKKLRP